MASNTSSGDVLIPESVVPRTVAIARFIVGLAQGALLYAVYNALQHKAWPATDGQIFAPLLLVSIFLPIILVSGLGHITFKRLVLWTAAATVIVWAVGFYDVWRLAPDGINWMGYRRDTHGIMPSAQAFFFTGVGLFIAHSLVLAATADKHWIAGYPSYFEVAWKLAIQIKFSALFVGVLWLVLWLGTSLFVLVKLDFLKDLLQEPWFSFRITALGTR